MKIKIVDNVVNDYVATEIEQVFLDYYRVWLYNSNTLGDENLDTRYEESFQLIHPILMEGNVESPFADLVLTVPKKISCDLNFSILNYKRVKVNQLIGTSHNKQHPPHTDNDNDNFISMIYYINDSDGDTLFYDQNHNVVHEVSPKKNRCVIFPSNILHASTSPVDNERRLVVNYVLSTDTNSKDMF